MRPLMSLLLLGLPWSAPAEDRELARMRELLSPMRHQSDMSHETRGASPELTAVKHQLREWVESRMIKARGRRELNALEIRLNDELREAKLSCALDYDQTNEAPCPEMNTLGYVGPVRLESREIGDMAVLRTRVGILCGADESAYAYQWWDDRWIRFWQTEQNDYRPGKYSPQTLEGVHISEMSQDRGQRLILTTGTRSWCTSAWHPVYYRVWRAGVREPAPKVLLDEREFAYLGGLPRIQGTVTLSEASVEYRVGSIDGVVHNRPEVRHYVVKADRMERIEPFARSPRDFVEEWLQHPWPDAALWTEPASRARLDQRHPKAGDQGVWGTFFRPDTFRCKEPDLWQVGLTLQNAPAYFLIRWRPLYRFALVDIRRKPWRHCTLLAE